ncbi:MAG: hypothetical protein RIQ99_469, partial [Pseudomonadota bacterium]
MALTPGLSPSLRLVDPTKDEDIRAGDDEIIVEDADEGGDTPEYDEKGNILSIEHPDGSITVSLDGTPVEEAANDDNPEGWFDNLADKIDDMELGRIAEDLMQGVEDDLTSRTSWIQERANGLRLLGLNIELPGTQGTAEGAPVEGMSRVRHPMLLEAVLRFQANARSELLPTDGPVKIREDNNNANLNSDQLANALELDLNHYLTSTATEYYPDTDRMLFMLGFGGSAFKKVYFCPLRQRPVSESVDADDLIVNNAATDLANAKRITHRILMKPSTVKRMQILGVYRDTELSTPMEAKQDSVRDEKKNIQGIMSGTIRPDDRDREIYEIYCELDIKGFEHKRKGKVTGLEIPYRVTIDVSSRKVLSVVRNYDEDTKDLPQARQNFGNYIFVPGLGFYGIGLLNILGNTTNAVTAAWREMLDAGMFASFPGFLMADTGARQNTNIFRVPPGGGALVKTGGMPIGQAIMPLPYKEPSQGLMALVENMAQTGMRIGGTSEMQVGEGRADAPVGTTLAMIEQATKVLNAVHKRMHAAQAAEFTLLVRCFKENPESFWQTNRRPAFPWDEQTFLTALEYVDGLMVPQADPNTASHAQRVMKIMALKQLQASNPTMYDPIAIDKAALQAIGWNNPEQFMAPPEAQGKAPPEMQKAQADLAIKKQDADTKAFMAKSKAQTDMIRAQADMAKAQQQPEQPGGLAPQKDPYKEQELALKAQQLQFQQSRAAADDQNRDLDRQADVTMEKMRLESDAIKAEAERAHQRGLGADKMLSEHIMHAHELAARTSPEG